MKSTPTARLSINSCCIPTIASRVRPIFALGSTMFPAGISTPLTKRELLDDGVPVSSLTWIRPSRLASVQHPDDRELHAPLDRFGPHRRRVTSNRPPSALARVI